MTSPPRIFPTAMPSWEGSLASRFLSLAQGSPKTIRGGSGPSSSESFAIYDPDTSSWKTCQVSLLPEWETFSETWPRSGMTRSGRAFPLPRLVPHISAGDSSLWPTPQAQEMEPTESYIQEMLEAGVDGSRLYLPGRKWHSRRTLARVVHVPWPTPTRADGEGGPGSSGRDGGDNLRTAVTKAELAPDGAVMPYPTPTASRTDTASMAQARYNADSRPDAISQGGGQLNPTWVEWLMGFPEGWTDLEDSETPSSPKSQNG